MGPQHCGRPECACGPNMDPGSRACHADDLAANASLRTVHVSRNKIGYTGAAALAGVVDVHAGPQPQSLHDRDQHGRKSVL